MIRMEPGGGEKEFNELINPGIPIPPQSTEIHGISDEQVADKPTFKDRARDINHFLSGADIGGYNHVKFDLPLLLEEFSRVDIPFDLDKRRLIDAQKVFFLMEPRSLTAAYRFYCNRELEGAHSAIEDVKATREVLMAQISKYDGKSPESNPSLVVSENMDQLHALTIGNLVDLAGRLARNNQGDMVFNFGKYKGRTVTDVLDKEPQYYDWIMKSEFPQDTKRILTQEKLKQSKL